MVNVRTPSFFFPSSIKTDGCYWNEVNIGGEESIFESDSPVTDELAPFKVGDKIVYKKVVEDDVAELGITDGVMGTIKEEKTVRYKAGTWINCHWDFQISPLTSWWVLKQNISLVNKEDSIFESDEEESIFE
jgi:hypothetical protein